MSERYTFVDIYNKDLDLNKDTKVRVSKVVIPKIQRPYAQGRQDGVCTYVRNTLLNEMFANFTTDEVFDLNFIYGIVRPSNDEYLMELLDGQQRMTTLFLVHWYIANAELAEEDAADKDIRDALGRFVYETRSTATVFCNKLASYRVDLDGQTPSQAIRRAKWYFRSFDRDSTISAMLTMLDAIHERYTKQERNDLHTKLANLQFYVKSLGYFNLSEELYIKMNARGLQLSPFENFKADLTNFVANAPYEPYKRKVSLYRKNSGEKVEFHFNFSVKLDAKWIDIFWKKGTENFDAAYMNFFTRFFACKYIVATKDVVSDRDIRQDATLRKLYTDAENSTESSEYLGFQEFERLLRQHPEYIETLDKVLDVFYEYDYKDDRRAIFKHMLPLWEKPTPDSGDDFYSNNASKMTHIKLIAFGAVIEFIDAYKDFDISTFNQWMRVVWNVIENTNIDSLTPVSSLIRKFSAVIRNTVRRSADGETFYTALSQWSGDNTQERENRALIEEVDKAGLISADKVWHDFFVEAEAHPFFKGMVLFFYHPDMSAGDFRSAYLLVKDMFDENGISPAYRENHLMIRAIVSHYCSWAELNELYVTERAETNKYLKNILASSVPVRNMFAEIAIKAKTEVDAKAMMEDYINNAAPFTAWPGASQIEEEYCQMAIDRIRHDIKLYDWIAEKEKQCRKVYRVYWYGGHVMFAVPRSWTDKVALDTERAAIAYRVANAYGFNYYDDRQLDMYEQYGDSFGNEIWLSQECQQCTFWVGLCKNHETIFSLNARSEQYAQALLKKFEGSHTIDEDGRIVRLPVIPHFREDESFRIISEKLEEVFKKVHEIETLLNSNDRTA